MKRNLLIATLALAPLVASANMTYTQGDLLVAFRALDGKGVTQDYLIDVGPVANLRDATTTLTSFAHLGSDFATTFGADWFTRTDIQWSAGCSPSNVSAVGKDARYTSYISQPEDVAGTPGSPPTIEGTSTWIRLSTTLVTNIQGEFKTNGVSSANPAATFQSTSTESSWSAYMSGGFKNYGADFNIFGEIEAIPAKTLSLFRISTDTDGTGFETGTYLGYLSINSTGDISFKPAPPSTGTDNTYTAWAATNAGGQGPTLDFDNDGVSNGLEYFMGSATGPTAHAVPTGGTVTWPRSATAVVTAFRVETSTDLVTWTTADPATVNAGTTQITFTPAAGAPKTFVRLAVDLP